MRPEGQREIDRAKAERYEKTGGKPVPIDPRHVLRRLGVIKAAQQVGLSLAAMGFVAMQPIFWTLPTEYLTNPKPGHAFVYVSTIQRMAINVLGRGAVFGGELRVLVTSDNGGAAELAAELREGLLGVEKAGRVVRTQLDAVRSTRSEAFSERWKLTQRIDTDATRT